jgi:serine/threonine protein kinase
MAEREAKHIFLQLMRAVCHLHNNNIAHRDIKTDNILMQSNNNIKLIDFGFATSV